MKFKDEYIKKVSLSDLKSICNLETKLFKENAFSKSTIKNLILNNTIFFKLEKRRVMKILLGFIIIVKDRKDRANIINILIKSKYQNKGYGSFLLKNTIEEVKKISQIKRIVLNVKIDNMKALKLYRKFNFKKKQTLEKYYNDKESAYLMELNIF